MSLNQSVDRGPVFLLGPNLGSPWMASVAEQGPRPGFELLILAGRDLGDEVEPDILFDELFVTPSASWLAVSGRSQESKRTALRPRGPARALHDIDSLGGPRCERDFRRLLPRVTRELLVGPGGRAYSLEVEPIADLWGDGAGWILFDLFWARGGSRRKNAHALCLLPSFSEPFGFVHLTDLHLARRNDEMLHQVLRDAHGRSPEEITSSYRNFNDHLRRALAGINEKAALGEVSFVVITGDLVDFAHYGWDDEPRFDGVNWRTFLEILTGDGPERDRGNPGLAVPCFTSLGNHDWRLHPYSPAMGSYASTFGLTKEEAKSVFYQGFSLDDLGPEAEGRERISDAMQLRLLGKTRRQKLARMATTNIYKATMWALQGLGGLVAAYLGLVGGWSLREVLPVFGINVLGGAAHLVARFVANQVSDWLVDNPLHAAPAALASYFAWVSPYLEQVFFFGPHRFVLSDTGPDLFVGQILEAKEWNRFKKMTLEDNILGGSPDSRAFLADHSVEDWSQLDWISQALSLPTNPDRGRTFVFLHAPPVNTNLGNRQLADFRESVRRKQGLSPWVNREEVNLTYGAVAQYLSQFLYLCLGTSEAEARHRTVPSSPSEDGTDAQGRRTRRPVDLVLCGHAHRNVEFRLGLEGRDSIRIFTDRYSEELEEIEDASARADWWNSHRPVVAQTAAAGPAGSQDPDPPYLRIVRLDQQGLVESFSVLSLAAGLEDRRKDG